MPAAGCRQGREEAKFGSMLAGVCRARVSGCDAMECSALQEWGGMPRVHRSGFSSIVLASWFLSSQQCAVGVRKKGTGSPFVFFLVALAALKDEAGNECS